MTDKIKVLYKTEYIKNKEELIQQLESLREEADFMITTSTDDLVEPFKADYEALDLAIRIIKKVLWQHFLNWDHVMK